MENNIENQMSSISLGYYGTQYRIRLYPPLEYSILYKEYDLTRFNHQKNVIQMEITVELLKHGLGFRILWLG